MNYFQLKPLGILSIEIQILLIVIFFIAMTLYRYSKRERISKEENQFSIHFAHMFAPIYEEILFRGLLFGGLLTMYSMPEALIISSSIFGIWHLKNIFVMSPKRVIYQILYAGLVFGPISAFVMFYTQTIWIGVIIHYTNNLWSHTQWDVYKAIGIDNRVKKIKGYIEA